MTPIETRDLLQSLPLFDCLQGDQLDQILDRHRMTFHESDQVIVMEQDWGESVFLLCSGLAKVRTHTVDGDEVVMTVLGSGDLFGELAVLDGADRSADVVAITSLCLVKFRAAPFTALLQKKADFALAFARLEASRLRDLNRRFALQRGDATARLLDALAYLARKSSGSFCDPQAPIPLIAQRELALIAGLSRETASRTLSKLRQRNIVADEDAGGLRIVDLRPLQKRGLLD